MHIHTQAHACKISFLTNDTSLLVKAEKAIPLNREIIICADFVSELHFYFTNALQNDKLQKCKYI